MSLEQTLKTAVGRLCSGQLDNEAQVIEGGMMNFGQRQAIRDDGLPQPLISCRK